MSCGAFLVKLVTSQNPPADALTLGNAYIAPLFVPGDLILINDDGGPLAANLGSGLLALFRGAILQRLR